LGILSNGLSELARRSITGLSRELTTLGWPKDKIAGFQGPDEWYASSIDEVPRGR